MVVNWCVRCTAFTRKRDRGALQLRDVELLPLVVLTARLQDMPPPGLVQTDAELDVADAAVSCRSDAAIATPKPKPTPKAVNKRPRRVPHNLMLTPAQVQTQAPSQVRAHPVRISVRMTPTRIEELGDRRDQSLQTIKLVPSSVCCLHPCSKLAHVFAHAC